MGGHSFGYQAAQYAEFGARENDPGDAGTIRFEPDGSHKTVSLRTSGAETRTVADPAGSGLVMDLFMTVDGGDCTVTFSTAFNEKGNTSIVFADPGAFARFVSVEVADDTYAWRLVKADGPTGTGVQGSALTAQLTTITHTAPGTPDYALQDLTNSSPYGFATQDEGNTLLSVVANLQARLAEVETALEALNLVAAN